jgi:predicted PurR-regulated permease PerM
MLPVEGEPPDEVVLLQVAQAFTYAGLVARGLLLVVSVFLLGFYWTLDSERTLRSLLLLIPMNQREGVREIISTIQARLGNYIRGQTILCLSIGGMALAAYLLIGVPYAFSLALFAGLMEAVPLIGPVLGAIPAALVVLGSGDPEKVLWVVVATVVIQTLEGNWLVPRIMGKSVGVSPFVTLLAIAAFSSLMGVAGAFLAIPIAAVVQVLMDRLLLQAPPGEQAMPESRDMLSVIRMDIQELTGDVRKQVREKDGAAGEDSDRMEDAIESIANELEQILVQASQTAEYERRALP